MKERLRRKRTGLCVLLCCFLLCSCGRQQETEIVRIGSLKGPTSLGILYLMEEAKQNQTDYPYEFQMATGADELLPLLVKGELDIALVPSNVAAVLYQKTEGGVTVIDINTLGVLYLITGASDITEVADLKGCTIYLTGEGTTPDASLNYILQQGGLTEKEYTLEYKSEPAEVAAILAQDPLAIGLLPQPFATAALMQNENLHIAFDISAVWESSQREGKSAMVTGVTIVRNDFLLEHGELVDAFLEQHRASVTAINESPKAGAALAVEAGIVAKEAVAREAIPKCNLVCITGKEMKDMLSAYLKVLAAFNEELVGGNLPEEDFYY